MTSHLLITGHIVIDMIVAGEYSATHLGGPPCYAGLTARELGLDVSLLTRFGYDFPEEYFLWLSRNQLKMVGNPRSTKSPTTGYRIVVEDGSRELFLEKKCDNINAENIGSLEADGVIVSPVAGEVDTQLLSELRKRCPTLYLDPQGFLRVFAHDGRCSIQRQNLEVLSYADILKVDEEEGYAYTGIRDTVATLRALSKIGPKILIGTRGGRPMLLMSQRKTYRIPVIRSQNMVDTTGLGDIFAGAFMARLLQEGDPVWAACFAGAMASTASKNFGLGKIPRKERALEVAEPLYDRIKVLSQ